MLSILILLSKEDFLTAMTLGEYIKKLREQKKKTLRQVELETKEFETNISNAHLSQIEKGVIEKPSLDLLKTLSIYFEVKLSYLESLAGYPQEGPSLPQAQLISPLRYITATDIVSYSNIMEAAGNLPNLIRDLILSTMPLSQISELEMPVGNSVYMHGWDGVLNYKGRTYNQFVPQGFSCWEMGKSKNINKKLTEDFLKRSGNPLGQDPKNS